MYLHQAVSRPPSTRQMQKDRTDTSTEPLPRLRPFYASTKFVLGFLIAGVVFFYGWRVTEIDPSALFKDAHLVKPLVVALLQPEVLVAEYTTKQWEVPFHLEQDMAFGFGAPTAPIPENKTQFLRISPPRGAVGDAVAVQGEGLSADSHGQLLWINSVDQKFPLGEIATDSNGAFESVVTVPPIARSENQKLRLVLAWPTGDWVISKTFHLTLEKIVETVFLGLMATTLSVLLAVPLSFLGARNLMTGLIPRGIYYSVRFLFNILRSVEPLIMAILFAVWVGIGPFAGVLALAVHSTAALGKLFSEQIESIDPGPVEAITATGAKPLQIMLYGVVPQVVPQFLALMFYRWDINIRMSTIIGFVGGGGIGFLLQQWINLLQYHKAATALWSIAFVVIALDLISARIREKITTV